MKLNRKGFMMAEVVVVSSIILIFLATLYTSYNQIYSVYKTRLNYYDATVLYQLGYYRDIYIENGQINEKMEEAYNQKAILLYKEELVEDKNVVVEETTDIEDAVRKEYDTVILGYTHKDKINPNEIIVDDINTTYKDYIKYLATAASIDSNYIMLIERCPEDKTNCKYGYIKIYDGYE